MHCHTNTRWLQTSVPLWERDRCHQTTPAVWILYINFMHIIIYIYFDGYLNPALHLNSPSSNLSKTSTNLRGILFLEKRNLISFSVKFFITRWLNCSNGSMYGILADPYTVHMVIYRQNSAHWFHSEHGNEFPLTQSYPLSWTWVHVSGSHHYSQSFYLWLGFSLDYQNCWLLW